MVLVSMAECFAIWWCSKETSLILHECNENKGNKDKKDSLITKVIHQAAWGRICVVLFLLLPIIFSLYAKQLGGIPFRQ